MKEIWHMVDKNGKRKKYIVDTETVLDGKLYFYQLTSEFIGTPFLYAYMKLTEPHKTDEWNALDRGELTPGQKAFKENLYLGTLLPELRTLFQIASYNHMLEAYRAGTITPELLQILTTAPPVAMKDNGDGGYYSNALAVLTGDENSFRQEVLQAAEAGKIDFSALAHDGNQEKDWFMKYRIAPNPLPGYYGSISTWEKLLPDGTPCLENYHKQTKEKIKKIVTDALRDGVNPEAVNTIANEIRDIYRRNRGTQRNTWNNIFRYRNSYEAGFVVDLENGKIYDLRHYADELAELLEPGFEPLKEFYYALNRYTKDYEKHLNPKERQQAEGRFLGKDPFMIMKNSPETNAIASASTGLAAMVVQQELPLLDENGKPLYNYSTNVTTKAGDLIVKVSETTKGRALTPGTGKLQILFDTLFTISGEMEFFLPIDWYMEFCKADKGKPTSPESRRKFKSKLFSNLRALKKATIPAKIEGAKEPGEIGILAAWFPMPGNQVKIEMEPRYCETLNGDRAGDMQITKAVFRLPETNPHLVAMLRKLSLNRTTYNNINCNETRKNRISFKTLYDNDLSFPRLKTLIKTRQYKRNVIDPMVNAIKILTDLGYITSKYIDPDGIEHTKEELENVAFTDFLDRKKWLLEYDLLDPDTGEPFKDNEKQIQAATKRKKEREEKKTLEHAKKVVAAANRKKREAAKRKKQEALKTETQ